MAIHHLAAAAANCNTGTWRQRWDCGWSDHTSTAARAGFDFGHNVLPVLILLAFVLLVARAARRRKAASAAAAARVKVPARR